MQAETQKKQQHGYIGRAWNAVKYYSQTSYYLAYVYGRMRGMAQPWISTKFNVHQVEDNVGVYIGDIPSAYNREELTKLGITHIVTAILAVSPQFPEDFVYKTVPVRDVESEDIQQYLPDTTKFIKDAVDSGGRVLVHCVCGVSRSATIVAAWMMAKDGYTSEEAIQHLQSRRECVNPNPAFREQLATLNEAETELPPPTPPPTPAFDRVMSSPDHLPSLPITPPGTV